MRKKEKNRNKNAIKNILYLKFVKKEENKKQNVKKFFDGKLYSVIQSVIFYI